MGAENAQREARQWFDRLSQCRITTAELLAFRAWRDDLSNDAAYRALEMGRQNRMRYVVRPMVESYRVIDRWTGHTVLASGEPQENLGSGTARRIAAGLNKAL